MQYKLEFTKYATRDLLKLPGNIRNIIINKLKILVNKPYAINHNIKKLNGIKDCYRFRVGNYRVIYKIIDVKLVIEIIKIGHRQEIYK